MANLPGGWELILVLLVVVVVFGSKRLPDSARALGRSMRILKAETKGLREDDAPVGRTTATQAVAPAQPVTPVAPVAQPAPVAQSVPVAQPYAGQLLFDAEGRPVQLPVNGAQADGARQAPRPQV